MSGSVEEYAKGCPACYSKRRTPYGDKNDLSLYRCANCSSLYSECSPLNYDDYYHDSNLTVPEFINHRLDEILHQLGPYRKTNHLLDVGCGAGSLLQAARRAGWIAEGLEISEPAVVSVRAQNFKVFQGELGAARYAENYFDVVTASELFEHVANPVEIVTEIARILRPGGLLWATTPNAGSFSSRVLRANWSSVGPPEHLQLFSLKGIRILMKRAGFRPIRVRTTGCDPIELWHGFWSRKATGTADPRVTTDSPIQGNGKQLRHDVSFDDVTNRYHLNEAMQRNILTRGIKMGANAALNLTRLGDTIKICAEKCSS